MSRWGNFEGRFYVLQEKKAPKRNATNFYTMLSLDNLIFFDSYCKKCHSIAKLIFAFIKFIHR